MKLGLCLKKKYSANVGLISVGKKYYKSVASACSCQAEIRAMQKKPQWSVELI